MPRLLPKKTAKNSSAIILFGSSAVILTLSFVGKKKSDQQMNQADVSSENHLLHALEFVDGREDKFIEFCKTNKIKYKTDYHQAVIKFYDNCHKPHKS